MFERSLGLPKLSVHAYGGQPYPPLAAEARARSRQSAFFPDHARCGIQICAWARREWEEQLDRMAMSRLRLKTQLLISTLLIICALTGAMLLIVRHTVRAEIDDQVRDSVAASVRAFESVQNQREDQLSRTTAMLAELPTLKALMTTHHAPTIRDGSLPFWQLAGSDLFLLSNPKGEMMALHAKKSGLNSADVERDLTRSLDANEDAAWWYADDQLYWAFIRPITAGSGSDVKQLGALAIGYQVDSTVAEQLALVAGGKNWLVSGEKGDSPTLAYPQPNKFRGELGQ